jgi:pyruvate dehydrogenase E2 component (dihydrolipoamide acetyltransferase)
VLAIAAAPGDAAAEHATIAVLGAEGEATPLPEALEGSTHAELETPSAVREVSTSSTSKGGSTSKGSSISKTSSTSRSGSSRGHASPRAAVVAERNGIDLSTVTGTGPGGRILALDVLAAKRAVPATDATPLPEGLEGSPTSSSPSSASGDGAYTSIPVRGARKVTAQRMQASLAEMAQVTLTRYANAAPLMSYLGRLRDNAERLDLPRLTVNDLVLFATARTMARHPEANATFDWSEIRQYSRVDLGVAVDTPRGLLVPVIRDAASLGLIDLARATASAVDAARSGSLTTDDMSGGTFTVSNLGGVGVHWFTPVVNPPQVCILGVGRALPASPAGPDLMPLSLTFDHRAIDGAAAGSVLADLADAIENIDILAAL